MRLFPLLLPAVLLLDHPRPPVEVPHGFTVDTLAPGVYAFVRKEVPAYGMESNSMLIVGARAAAIVDAQLSVSDTREVIAATRRLTSVPIRYVINTHCHDDHVTGNVAWREAFPDVAFVASAAMADELKGICAANRASFRKQGAGAVAFLHSVVDSNRSLAGGRLDDEERIAHLSYARLIDLFVKESEPDAIGPTVTFGKDTSIDLGGRLIRLKSLGRGHSAGDIVVWLPLDDIVAAGDLVVWPVPFVGTTSFPGEFADALRYLLALDAKVIVPGHGPLMRDTAYVHDTIRLLDAIHAQVTASVEHGDSLPATRKAVNLSEFRALFGGTSKLRQGLFDTYVTSSAIPAEYEQVRRNVGGR